jgi:hypothetical protein
MPRITHIDLYSQNSIESFSEGTVCHERQTLLVQTLRHAFGLTFHNAMTADLIPFAVQ